MTILEQQMIECPAAILRKYYGKYRRAVTGRSRADAIQCKCLECVGNGRLRDVYECTDTTCSLFAFRPKPKAQVGRQNIDRRAASQEVAKNGTSRTTNQRTAPAEGKTPTRSQ